MATIRVFGDGSQPGDLIAFLGHVHLIDRIVPHPSLSGCRIAYADRNWQITLEPRGQYDLVRRG